MMFRRMLERARRSSERGFTRVLVRPVGLVSGPITVRVHSAEAVHDDYGVHVLLDPRPCDFFLPPGSYRLHLREYGPAGEAVRAAELPLEVSAEKRTCEVEVRLDEMEQRSLSSAVPTRICVVPSLNIPEFSRAAVRQGLHDPLGELNAGRALLCAFSEPDARIPVVFVHGIDDSPRSFTRLIGALDTRVFQPWCYCYPTGLPLSTAGTHLYSALNSLYLSFGFSELRVVAHSMGGLVAAHFLKLLGERASNARYCVPQLITLSTPWLGHGAAEVGRRISPFLLPCWEEIASGSEFIRALSPAHLPPETEYQLLFSYRRRGRLGFAVSGLPFAGNHDGFVTLESQLSEAAQQRAARIRGFNEDHRSIVAAAPVAAEISSLLSQSVPAPQAAALR